MLCVLTVLLSVLQVIMALLSRYVIDSAIEKDGRLMLQDFHCRLPLEDWSCLTGMSGRGKTTVFKLILGLYTPQQGRIYVQTANGCLPCAEATRHLFAYVPQDYALFSGTVLENFQLIDPDAGTEEAVLKGLESLGKKAILVTHRPEMVQELADVIFVSME